MRASYQWLRELSGVEASAQDMAERLTRQGIEVEAIHNFAAPDAHVRVGQIKSAKKHPERDKLHVVQVDVGGETLNIVCGAQNIPAAGAFVAVATAGAALPNDLRIAARELGGVQSQGM